MFPLREQYKHQIKTTLRTREDVKTDHTQRKKAEGGVIVLQHDLQATALPVIQKEREVERSTKYTKRAKKLLNLWWAKTMLCHYKQDGWICFSTATQASCW